MAHMWLNLLKIEKFLLGKKRIFQISFRQFLAGKKYNGLGWFGVGRSGR
jgi:hypothetical protein